MNAERFYLPVYCSTTVTFYGRGFLQIHPNKKPVWWIRIRIHFSRLGPDPRGPEWQQKWRKLKFWCARCSLLRDEDLFRSLDLLYGSLEISKMQLDQKHLNFYFNWKFFPIFGHQIPGPVSTLKLMRIHNTACRNDFGFGIFGPDQLIIFPLLLII